MSNAISWSSIASLATAGGTLVLAVATFGSIKSANRAARAAERSLLAGLRPVLVPSRDDDPEEHVLFGDGQTIAVPPHSGVIEAVDGSVYMALTVRNAGNGLAVMHGWRARAFDSSERTTKPELDEFRVQQLDLYIPSGDTGFWQGAMRDRDDPDLAPLAAAASSGGRVVIDLLYGDHEGGQRTIVRFSLRPSDGDGTRLTHVLRYWNVDGDDPRIRPGD